MRYQLPIILAPLLLMQSACGALQGSPIQWPDLVRCGPGVSDLVGTVTRVLDGADYREQLADLALTHGTEAVVCLVDRLVTDWGRPGASMHEKRALQLERGRAFLREAGTQVWRE